MATKDDLYENVTNRIIKALEAGTTPWQKPWTSSASVGLPKNGVTSRQYNGINAVLLWIESGERGYTDNRWLTFKQSNDAGFRVRKGEKSTPVYFYKPLVFREKDKVTGEDVEKKIPFLTEYKVFNAHQIDGIAHHEVMVPEWSPIEAAQKFIADLNPVVRHGGNRAYYDPLRDFIQMPAPGDFPTSGLYTGTLLHELAHWTGHEARLNRTFGRFGEEGYAREELRAEIASAMLCACIGVPPTIENHAAYVKSWIKILRDDKREILRAASDATRIAEYVQSGGKVSSSKPAEHVEANPIGVNMPWGFKVPSASLSPVRQPKSSVLTGNSSSTAVTLSMRNQGFRPT